MNRTVYLDQDTRVAWKFQVQSAFAFVHVLQRRVPCMFGHRWITTAWIYNSIIDGSEWDRLLSYLLWEESRFKFKYGGYTPTK